VHNVAGKTIFDSLRSDAVQTIFDSLRSDVVSTRTSSTFKPFLTPSGVMLYLQEHHPYVHFELSCQSETIL